MKLSQLSIIIPVNSEGRMLHATLKSVQRAASVLKGGASSAETIIVVDCADEKTKKYLKNYPQKILTTKLHIHETAFNNMAKARNFGISHAKSDAVALVEPGDLVSKWWFHDAIKVLQAAESATILHPEYQYQFGDQYTLWKVEPSHSRLFTALLLLEKECFPAAMLTTRDVAIDTPYPDGDTNNANLNRQWHARTLSKDIVHSTVPKTLYARCYRETGHAVGSGLLERARCVLHGKIPQSSPETEDKVLQVHPYTNKFFGFGRKAVNSVYSFRISRMLRSKSARYSQYTTSLKNETLHLLRPITGGDQKVEVPQWLMEEVRELNKTDLKVFYLEHVGQNLQSYSYQPSPYIKAYDELMQAVGSSVDRLFFVPYVKNGGAEKELDLLTRLIHTIHPNDSIVVLATENSSSPWADHLHDRVQFREPGETFWQLDLSMQSKLLAEVVLQLQPIYLHAINSLPAYKMLQTHSEKLSQNTKLFLTIFSIDKTVEGMNTHSFVYYMGNAIDYITKVFTDNQTVADQLAREMAIEKSKFSVHYQPIGFGASKESGRPELQRLTRRPLKVLWAGRMDRQKRPDILVRIASESAKQGLPVEFHAYGSPAFDGHFLEAIKESPEVHYRGPYEGGLNALPTEEYDVFLLTSQWEGMPNVLLEAVASGLLLIATNAGGVSELVLPDKTGYLVKCFDDIPAYVQHLRHILDNPAHAKKLSIAAQKLVAERHSKEHYEIQIQAEEEYV